MNATIMKGERSKLLAVAAVIAMVACALVAFMPTSDAADGPVDAADSYTYTDGFEYTGERTVVGDDVIMVYPQAYDAAMLAGMNDDFPRFVGALYRADNGVTVSSITYNGVEYTWNTQGTLKGSNWVDAEGKTLVAAVASELGTDIASMISTGGSITLTLGLADGTSIEMTYTVSAPVASIGETYYGTLQAAVKAVKDGETITLNKHAADENGVIQGNGVKFETKNYTITLDFNGLTYDINGTTVGSSGTETNGFQLLRDNNVTLRNGTIISTSPTAGIILQNYCNLTLDDFTVDASANSQITYASSNNCGNVTFSGATNIVASKGNVAFDICGYASYSGVSVTIADDFTGTINGKVEVTRSSGNTNPVNFNINADVSIESIDVQTGNVTIAEDVTVTAKNVTVGSDAVLSNSGSIIGDVENNGYVITNPDSGVAEAGSFDALLNAIADVNVKTIYLVGDEPFVADKYITSSTNRGLTIDLNGKTLNMGSYAINLAGITLNVTDGSTLISDGRIGYIENMKSFDGASIDIDGARLFQGVAGTDDSKNEGYAGNITYPEYADGVKVTKNGYWYTVCHGGTVNDIRIQYGAAFPNFEYDGTAHTELTSIQGFVVTSLDNYFTTATGGEGTISYDPAYADTGADQTCTNAGTYALHVVIEIIASDGSYTSLSDDLTFEILPATPDMTVTIGGDDKAWTLDAFDEKTDVLDWDYTGETVNGVVYDKDAYEAAGGDVTFDFYQKVNGEWFYLEDVDETNYMNLPIGEYRVEATASAVQNYAKWTVPQDFKVLAIEIDISISNDEGTDYWGTSADRYVGKDFQAVTTTTETGKDLSLKGGIYWLDDVNDADITLENGTLFGEGMDQGYYAVYYIINNSGFDVIVTYSQEEDAKEHPIPAGYGYPMLHYLGNDITDVRENGFTIYVSATDDRGIESESYDVDCSGLYRIATAGYAADAENGETLINEEFTWNKDAETPGIHDVAPDTMWIAFDEGDVAQGATLTGKLYYVSSDGTEESLTIDPGQSTLTATGTDERIWYFTMDETLGTYIGVPATPGYYKLEICDADNKVIASAYTCIEGMTGAGYEDAQKDAIDGINGDGFPQLGTGDISPETFWIAWYEGDAMNGTFAAYLLDADGNKVYTAPATDVANWNTAGYHYWAFSKAEGVPSSIESLFDLAPGEYKLVVIYNGDEASPYQATDVIVPGPVIGGFDENPDDVLQDLIDQGYTADQFTDENGISPDTMWLVWYGQDYEEVTANLYYENGTVPVYTESTEGKPQSNWLSEGKHIWYFSFGQDASLGNIMYDLRYGTYTLEFVDQDEKVLFTYEIPVYDPDRYVVNLIEDDADYDRTLIFGFEDTFYLPGSGMEGKTIDYWYLVDSDEKPILVDGKEIHINENGVISIGVDYIDLIDKQTYSFKAHYATEESDEPAISTNLDFEIEALATGLQIHMEALDGNILPSGSFDVTFYYYILDEIEGIGSMELAIPVVIEDVEFDNTDTQYSAVNVKVPIQWSDYLGNEDIIFDEPFIAYATYTANDGASYDVPIYTFDVSFLG